MPLDIKTSVKLYDAINAPSMNCVEKPDSWKTYDSFCKEFNEASEGHTTCFRVESLREENWFPVEISFEDYVFFSNHKIKDLIFRIRADKYLFKSSKQKDVDMLIHLLLVESTASTSQLERITELLYTYHI